MGKGREGDCMHTYIWYVPRFNPPSLRHEDGDGGQRTDGPCSCLKLPSHISGRLQMAAHPLLSSLSPAQISRRLRVLFPSLIFKSRDSHAHFVFCLLQQLIEPEQISFNQTFADDRQTISKHTSKSLGWHDHSLPPSLTPFSPPCPFLARSTNFCRSVAKLPFRVNAMSPPTTTTMNYLSQVTDGLLG